MPFDRGNISFSMFEIPEELPENIIDLFAAHKAGTLDSVNEEPQVGWVTGHHLLDTNIDMESAQMGGCYFLTLRQAVRKMPSVLLDAICKREEAAYLKANNLERISGKIRRQIKEEAIERHGFQLRCIFHSCNCNNIINAYILPNIYSECFAASMGKRSDRCTHIIDCSTIYASHHNEKKS